MKKTVLFQTTQSTDVEKLNCLMTLRFHNRHVEKRYLQYHHQAWSNGDVQASIVQGLFSVAIILAARKFASVTLCSIFSVAQLVGTLLQLLLAVSMQHTTYGLCRPWLCLWFRVLYLVASAVGLGGRCGGSAAGRFQGRQENLFSAFLWRGGIISMAWHSLAFPMLFWQNLLVQAAYLAAACIQLTPAVCGELANVHLGEQLALTLHTLATEAWALLLESGGGGIWAAPSSHGAAAGCVSSLGSNGTCSWSDGAAAPLARDAVAREQCIDVMVWSHFVAGILLPGVVLYNRECSARARWWRSLTREQQQRMMRPAADSSSSPRGALVFFFVVSGYLLAVVVTHVILPLSTYLDS